MDEYLLADSFISFEPIDTEELSGNYEALPLDSLAGLGGILAVLVQQLKSGEGLYRAFNPKTGEMLKHLQIDSKQMLGAKVGALIQADGKFDQAAFVAADKIAAVDPMTLAVIGALTIILNKIGGIEEGQKNIFDFLKAEKRTQLEGCYSYLQDVYNNYKYNWDNKTFIQSAHIKSHDIMQKAEESIKFYSEQIDTLLHKKKALPNRKEITSNIKSILEQFSCYKLAVYLFSFASFMEVLVLGNYSKRFLDKAAEKIRDYSYKYSMLYTKCYTKFSNLSEKAIEANLLAGAAKAAQTAGKVINKIPIIEKGPVDEALIEAGKKLEDFNETSIENMLNDLVKLSSPSTAQFSNAIDSLNKLHNSEIEVLADQDNLYVKLAV